MSREKLAESLLTFIPMLHKKIFHGFNSCDIPKPHLGLLFHISAEDGKPMRYYGDKMMVSKPNLTVIADKLIEEGYLERVYEPNDRRIIKLKLTSEGLAYLNEQREKLKNIMAAKLDGFEEKDIERLSQLLDEMKEIFKKMQ